MTRTAAREIAVGLVYNYDFFQDVDELLSERFSPEFYERLADEDVLYEKPPDAAQTEYLTRVFRGVVEHMAELDGYIERLSIDWKFGRLPRVALAIMRISMFEVLYMDDIPTGASISEAVEISKKYEPREVTAFINGILGTFARTEANHE